MSVAFFHIALLSLFILLLASALLTAYTKNLFTAAMLMSAFSLLSAALFVALDAVDVAFTEAAVAAGASTILILEALAFIPQSQKHRAQNIFPALLVTIPFTIVLIVGMTALPPFGQPDNPAALHVANLYIQQTPVDIQIPNLVTAVLASYRGYDTLGETFVILTAGAGVLAVLGTPKPQPIPPIHPSPVLLAFSRVALPAVVLFALYVQFHGDYGPGGGFQAGVLLASASILVTLLYGAHIAHKAFPVNALIILASSGALLYLLAGFTPLLLQHNFLDYDPLGTSPIAGQHLGILVIELGVCFTVAGVVSLLHHTFVSRIPANH